MTEMMKPDLGIILQESPGAFEGRKLDIKPVDLSQPPDTFSEKGRVMPVANCRVDRMVTRMKTLLYQKMGNLSRARKGHEKLGVQHFRFSAFPIFSQSRFRLRSASSGSGIPETR